MVVDAMMPSTTGSSAIFDIPYNHLDNTNWFLIIVIFMISIPLYMGLSALFKIIENKLLEKEPKFYENFKWGLTSFK